ncbi:MAG: sugar phosphate isomerase/epimerase [Planctomycetes bacterium]|nr:sugar phosphate isomerase/epimerase [Planctomycetota bacterium]
MRLGGPVFGEVKDPAAWVQALKACGYRAAYCPVQDLQQAERIRDFAQAARAADIVIAEVGAWSNPISPNDEQRAKALALNQERLALADRIGARCCVNIAGSRSAEFWHGPSSLDLTRETFDLIVETVRRIIDAVKPSRTAYCLETMPWCYPDSPDSYLELLQAVDRKAFAVHLDPTNLVCSPQRYFGNGDLIHECFRKLGPHVRSCHAKDILMANRFMVHLDEVRPGLGVLDYRSFLSELDRLDPDVPLMMEHLPSAEEYTLAAAYIRSVASQLAVKL